MSDFAKDINVPTNDCISRQAAIDALYDWSEHSMTDAEAWHIRQVIGDIKSMPSAEPVRHGKWVNANEGRWNTCEVLKCSECGELDNRMYKTDKYCPNCGCRMDKE